MRNMIKFCVIFLGFSLVFLTKSISADNILPLPKPAVDQETKAKARNHKQTLSK